jgi:invasion protein IalB
MRVHPVRFALFAAALWSVLVCAPDRSLAAERVALVIGNADYTATTVLRNPSNDATDMSRTLRELGFEVVEGLNLNRAGMEAKIREFSRKLAGAEMALFFYAGHAVQVDGRNHLLPVDARLEQAGDLELDTVDVQVVLRQMENQVRVSLVFIDACRDNPLQRTYATALGPSRSASLTRGLASVRGTVGTLVAFATEPGSVAQDGAGRNSPFTTALLSHIRTPGMEISALMRQVRADVIAATNRRQVPWDHSSLVSTVVLVPGSGGTSIPPSPTETNTGPGNAAIVYSPWTKFCGGDDRNPQAKATCLTVKEARLESGQFLAGAALIEAGSDRRVFRVTVPLGMELPQGTRLLLDNEQPMTGRFYVCLANGCIADFDVTPDFVDRLKRSRQLVLQGINLPSRPASYTLSMVDFAAANEGPPTDPKAYEENQKRLREERKGASK